ncbi:MAG TPA: glycoside hydrolase family 18 protein [Nocardioides sp.]|nr:glycoside hydrolase family 18 protein [Nocardioides sp.]
MRTVLGRVAVAAALVVAPLAGLAPLPGAPGAAAAGCTPTQSVSSVRVSASSSAVVTSTSAKVVRRSAHRATVRARVGARGAANATFRAVATVDTCPSGVSAPRTREETKAAARTSTASATRTVRARTVSLAKRKARAKARATAASVARDHARAAATSAARAAAETAALAAAKAASTAGEATGRWSVGYYAGYEADDYPAAQVAWSALTHLAVAFYLPHGDGTMDGSLFQGSEAQGASLAAGLIDAAHAHDVQALASIGGAGTGPDFHAAASGHLAALVDSILALRDEGYDGVDLDWEPLDDADQPLLADLATAIRTAWPDAVLTAPMGFVNINFPPDLGGMAEVAATLDQLNLMTYSMAGAYPGWQSWHSSPLSGETGSTPTSVASTVQAYLDAGVPAGKLGVGIGAYGLCYSSPVTGPGQALGGAEVVKEDFDLQFRDIRTDYQPAMARAYDATAQAPYLSGSHAGCSYISYEDEQSVGAKAAWLAEQGLGGVIMWTINQQHVPVVGAPAQTDPLLATVASSWLGR